MTRGKFLNTSIPIIPYLFWEKRNSSRYAELIAGDFYKKRVVLLWRTWKPEDGNKAEGKVVAYYNDTEKPEKEWHKELFREENAEKYQKQLKRLEEYIKT